jgi:hypothetical protein
MLCLDQRRIFGLRLVPSGSRLKAPRRKPPHGGILMLAAIAMRQGAAAPSTKGRACAAEQGGEEVPDRPVTTFRSHSP